MTNGNRVRGAERPNWSTGARDGEGVCFENIREKRIRAVRMTRNDVSACEPVTPEKELQLLGEGIQQLALGISIFDEELCLVTCNRHFQRAFKLSDMTVHTGASLTSVLHRMALGGAFGEVDPDQFSQQWVESLRQAAAPFSALCRAVDGRIFESRTSRLPSGGFITLYDDISHHQEARQRLIESRRTLADKTAEMELILENASLGILTVVPNGDGQRIMRRVNRALEHLLGYGIGELEGRATRMLYPDDAEYELVSTGYRQVICSGGTYHHEHVFAKRDGGTMIGILRGSAIDPGDLGRGAIWLIEDITEQKRIETELAAKSALLQAGTDNMPGALVIWDKHLRYIWWTPRAEYYFDLPPGTVKVGLELETMTRFFAQRGDFGPGSLETLVEEQMRPFRERRVMHTERRMPNGTVLEVRRNPLPDGGYVSIFQDITARKRIENELRLAKEAAEATAERLRRRQDQVHTLLNSSGQGFLSFDARLRIDSEYSQACVSMLGGAPAGGDLAEMLFPEDLDARERLRQLIPRIIQETGLTERACLLMQLPSEFRRGELYLEASFRMLGQQHMMVVLTDVTAERRFRTLSATDRLTGLANRRKLDEVLDYEHERVNRTLTPLSILMVDIDRFKAINDTQGHQAGDRVLIDLAKILQEGVRKIDCVGRWGGEEFMILCPDTGLAGATELAHKLRLEIAAHLFVTGHLTCSIGVAQYRLGESNESVLKRADQALYRAKQAGRNKVVAES